MKQGDYKPLPTPIYWLGTKVRMRDKILPLIARFKRKLYVEPFGGAGGILLGKAPERAEVYNDVNSLLVNMFRTLRDKESIATLKELLAVSPISRTMFRDLFDLANAYAEGEREEYEERKEAENLKDYPDELVVAYAFFYAMNSCYRGRIRKISASFAGGQKGDSADNSIRCYSNARNNLDAYCDRLKTVCVENLDYATCITKYDDKDTLFYIDPPYACEVSKDYDTGWSKKDEENLIDLLIDLKGSFILSCYDTPGYQRLLEHGATREQYNAFSTLASTSKGGEEAKRVETIYWRGKSKNANVEQRNLIEWLTM